MNCVGRDTVEVRTAGSEKWLQLPVPAINPVTTKPAITMILAVVSTFCTLATSFTPKQFSRVNPTIRSDATTCPQPIFHDQEPAPTTMLALDCCSAGKKKPR